MKCACEHTLYTNVPCTLYLVCVHVHACLWLLSSYIVVYYKRDVWRSLVLVFSCIVYVLLRADATWVGECSTCTMYMYNNNMSESAKVDRGMGKNLSLG